MFKQILEQIEKSAKRREVEKNQREKNRERSGENRERRRKSVIDELLTRAENNLRSLLKNTEQNRSLREAMRKVISYSFDGTVVRNEAVPNKSPKKKPETPLQAIRYTLAQKRERVGYGILRLASHGSLSRNKSVGLTFRLNSVISGKLADDMSEARLRVYDVVEGWGKNEWTECDSYESESLDRSLRQLATRQTAMEIIAKKLVWVSIGR